jgi:hypothetical protein
MQLLPEPVRCDLGRGTQNNEALTFLLVWDRSHNTGCVTKNLIDRFFDAQVWDHLTTDLAEARKPIGNANETIVVNGDNVASDIPPIS